VVGDGRKEEEGRNGLEEVVTWGPVDMEEGQKGEEGEMLASSCVVIEVFIIRPLDDVAEGVREEEAKSGDMVGEVLGSVGREEERESWECWEDSNSSVKLKGDWAEEGEDWVSG
jgi:hypothetical protein